MPFQHHGLVAGERQRPRASKPHGACADDDCIDFMCLRHRHSPSRHGKAVPEKGEGGKGLYIKNVIAGPDRRSVTRQSSSRASGVLLT
jgi:hypothetical protein